MFKQFTSAAVTIAVCVLAAGAAEAQEWRGMGRVGGKVVDESGKPIAGVSVTARMPDADNRGPEASRSNDKGEWAVGGIRGGKWDLDFEKDGYETFKTSLGVSEVARARPLEIVLKKKVVVVDPNVVIKEKLVEAAALMTAQKFAEARAIYEALAAAHPDVKQFKPLIARAYYGEGNKEKAIELLREASAADPSNAEVKMLLSTLLIEAGQADEAKSLIASVDDAKITDPLVYVNIAIVSINDNRHAEALPVLEKAIARFPDHPDAYYYRGISLLATGKVPEAKADLEKFIRMAKPDAPELPLARQILDSIKAAKLATS